MLERKLEQLEHVTGVRGGVFQVNGILSVKGSIEFKTVQILSGEGVPTVVAPDGSLFLRTDGTVTTTTYQRVSGSWDAL